MKRRDLLTVLGSAAVLRPVGVHAQQPGKVYRIAGVNPSNSTAWLNEAESPRYWRPFFDELRRQGFVVGQNLAVERYSGDGQTDRYAELARRVAASKPDAIFCASTRMAGHMKAATATIPIVASASNPVGFGLVPSLAHPGGNITGVASNADVTFNAKRLELLREVAPGASRVAYLTPRAIWESPIQLTALKEAAMQVGVSLLPALLDPPIQGPEYRRAFAAIERSRADALMVGTSPENSSHGPLIIELAALGRLPAIYSERHFAESGGLMSYGADIPDLNRHAGAIVAQILKGANPGDIPFYQASRYEFVINLKTAKALGLTIPPVLFARADEVIE